MPQRKGLVAPQNTFLDTIATRFDGTHSNFVLGNAQVRDHPIVYCSDGLIELTGYNRSQIMSRCCSCSFLWGEQTTEQAKQQITDALTNKNELQIEVYFHKKTGCAFLCLMDIVPIKNDKSQVVLFLVSHKDITTERHTKGHSESAVSPSSCTNKTHWNHIQQKSPLVSARPTKPASFLSAGLATTITAAALGTTAFRKNKLLDYLHANQAQISQVCPTRPIPVLCTPTQTGVVDLDESHLNLRGARRSQPRLSLTKSDETGSLTPKSSRHASLTERDSLALLPDVDSCEKGLSRSNTNNSSVNITNDKLANQTLLVSDSDDADSDKSTDSDVTEDASTAYKFQRRRSRAVLYQLSGRFDQKSKRKTPLKKFQRISGKEAIPEYKVQDVQASRFILLHYSLFKIIWDWMILICTFYIAIMVPYNAAFSLDTDGKDLLICDIIVELIFIIDIILNFLTTYVSKSGQVVYHTRAIAINYLRGWFFLDLVAAIPFDVILAVHNRDVNDTIGGVGSWIQLLKLARLLRLARLIQKIERYSQYSTVILGLLMCMFFLIAHWFACGWFWIGWADYESSKTREYSWLFELSRRMQVGALWNHTESWSRRALYVSSLYFTTTSLTSVGFGNVSPNTVNEKIFSIIAMLIGALMHAAVFGNVTTLIQRMYARRSAYQTKNQDLKDFTRAHHIPKPLKQRMLEFFQAMWAINRGIDKEAIMESFPENLRGDIALHLNREMLSLPLFKTASPGCRKCLAQMISTRFATPGEYLVNRGDLLRYIFLVCSGSLEILGPEGTVVGLLGKCDIFGSDIDDRPSVGFSAYDVKSLTYCELQCLSLDVGFLELLNQYPIFKKEFAAALHEELSFNIREGFDPSVTSEILPAITLRPGDLQSTCMDKEVNDAVKLSDGSDDVYNEVDPTHVLHLGFQKSTEAVNHHSENQATMCKSTGTSSTLMNHEAGLLPLTNSIPLLPELSDCLEYIDSQTTGNSSVACRGAQTPLLHGPLQRRTSKPNALSASDRFWAASCPNLSTRDKELNDFEHEFGHDSSSPIFQWDPKKISSLKSPTEHLGQVCPTSKRNNHSSNQPTIQSPFPSGPVQDFLCQIHQELRMMRTEIKWLSQYIVTLQFDLDQIRSPDSVHKQSTAVSNPAFTSTQSQQHSESHSNSHKQRNTDSPSSILNSPTRWTLSDNPSTSNGSPIDNQATTQSSSIRFSPTHTTDSSVRHAADHKVVKFQLPPSRRTLNKQHSNQSTSRRLFSPSRLNRERGRLLSTDSDSLLMRSGTPLKRPSSPYRREPH